jgi:murein DD-endopeptidase MepM/ murein hydrolase activator NlpD
MRRLAPNSATLRALVFASVVAACAAFAAPASAGGGAAAPTGTGGAKYGQPVGSATPTGQSGSGSSEGRPLLTRLEVRRKRFYLYGLPAQVRFQIEDRSPTVRVRLYLRRAGQRTPVRNIFLGERKTGVTHTVSLTGRQGGVLPEGRYEVRLGARDTARNALRRAASASAAQRVSFYKHRFPLLGQFSYGGSGSRFGAPRHGHRHQGQDLTAPSGTPVVAPRGGVVEYVGYQAGGAGHYIVLDGRAEDRDYIFMHLRTGSIRVRAGQRVRTGQRLAGVGSTGGSSGPHLHFEIWVGGGWYTGGHPVDPLRYLKRWDRWS